jgi:hypothetical protein
VKTPSDSLLEEYIGLLTKKIPFTFLKINHGFWDKIAKVEPIEMWPNSLEEAKIFAESVNLPTTMISEYVNELMHLLALHRQGRSSVEIYASVSARPSINPNSRETNPNGYLIDKYLNQKSNPEFALFMKHICETGQIVEMLDVISARRVVVVAPYLVTRNFLLEKFENIAYVDISFQHASIDRWSVLEEIEMKLSGHKDPVLLVQAGTLSIYWGMILKLRIPDLTILDMGMALGTFAPQTLSAFPYPWTSLQSEQILESSRRIALKFSYQDEIQVSIYSPLLKMSFEAKQLALSGTKNPELSARISFSNIIPDVELGTTCCTMQ